VATRALASFFLLPYVTAMTKKIIAVAFVVVACASTLVTVTNVDAPLPSGAIVTCGIAGAENCIRSAPPPPGESRRRTPISRDRSGAPAPR
jgi:hypothetical protein